MADKTPVLDEFQKTLGPFIKPREQVNYIRRVLALHLGSCSHDGPIKQPLALEDSSGDVSAGPELRGIQREYIEALKANVAARRKHADVAQANLRRRTSEEKPVSSGVELVEERVALLKLQDKQKRVTAVQNSLDLLAEKPAGSIEFLDPEDMFRDAPDLPSVPKEVVNSIVAQQTAPKLDLKEQISQLEKTVLRAKLLLRREEQLLREARSNTQNLPDAISNGIKWEALNATRNELITWIETELGKASSEEAEGGADGIAKSQDRLAADNAAINSHLGVIKDKYGRYISARRSLLEILAERPGTSQPPVLKPQDTHQLQAPESDPTPSNYLLTPYIETLLSLARNQRAMITQKSYINSTLSKETKDACQVLGHIAEESQLLPQHPQSTSSRRRSGLGEVLLAPERSGLTGRVQPWVNAADSAKIVMLEAVAEKVEEGQLALENSMKALRQIGHLLGQDEEVGGGQEDITEDTTESDFWMNAGPKHPSKTRRHTEKKPKDAWSGVHGNLGLIGHDDA